ADSKQNDYSDQTKLKSSSIGDSSFTAIRWARARVRRRLCEAIWLYPLPATRCANRKHHLRTRPHLRALVQRFMRRASLLYARPFIAKLGHPSDQWLAISTTSRRCEKRLEVPHLIVNATFA